MSIDIDDLSKELLGKGTDERLTRALLVLAKHINVQFEALIERIDERIEYYRSCDDFSAKLTDLAFADMIDESK